jgi:hypothetical protein
MLSSGRNARSKRKLVLRRLFLHPPAQSPRRASIICETLYNALGRKVIFLFLHALLSSPRYTTEYTIRTFTSRYPYASHCFTYILLTSRSRGVTYDRRMNNSRPVSPHLHLEERMTSLRRTLATCAHQTASQLPMLHLLHGRPSPP